MTNIIHAEANRLYDDLSTVDCLRKIERAGRCCYKSEMSKNLADCYSFLTSLISRGHESVLEHGNLIFKCEKDTYYEWHSYVTRLSHFGVVNRLRFTNFDDRYIVSGNIRAWRDALRAIGKKLKDVEIIQFNLSPLTNDIFVQSSLVPLFKDLSVYTKKVTNSFNMKVVSCNELTPQELLIHHTATVHFVVDRGITHELVRHRVFSFSQESTRYCNYSKDKFNNEITTIMPLFFNGEERLEDRLTWASAMNDTQRAYFKLLENNKCTPQEARSVLPNSLKAEIYMTGTLRDWRHFFKLRCARDAHPQMQEVTLLLYIDFKSWFIGCGF